MSIHTIDLELVFCQDLLSIFLKAKRKLPSVPELLKVEKVDNQKAVFITFN